uniref:Uncharacterized protein n=1 Tax=Anguilla anguilla TaxID=7936 RepID=A0A0E9X7R7_ANGAN
MLNVFTISRPSAAVTQSTLNDCEICLSSLCVTAGKWPACFNMLSMNKMDKNMQLSLKSGNRTILKDMVWLSLTTQNSKQA